MSQGSVIPLPSAGFALEHCRISFLDSRLPSRLVSRFDPSASLINVYVLLLGHTGGTYTCNTSTAQDRQFDPSRRDAAIMGAPAHMGLDVPWVAHAHHLHLALCSIRPNNTYIQRSLAMPSLNPSLLLVFMINSRDTIHTCPSHLKLRQTGRASPLCTNTQLGSPRPTRTTHPQPCLL